MAATVDFTVVLVSVLCVVFVIFFLTFLLRCVRPDIFIALQQKPLPFSPQHISMADRLINSTHDEESQKVIHGSPKDPIWAEKWQKKETCPVDLPTFSQTPMVSTNPTYVELNQRNESIIRRENDSDQRNDSDLTTIKMLGFPKVEHMESQFNQEESYDEPLYNQLSPFSPTPSRNLSSWESPKPYLQIIPSVTVSALSSVVSAPQKKKKNTKYAQNFKGESFPDKISVSSTSKNSSSSSSTSALSPPPPTIATSRNYKAIDRKQYPPLPHFDLNSQSRPDISDLNSPAPILPLLSPSGRVLPVASPTERVLTPAKRLPFFPRRAKS
jgi:hypothetical protein